MDYSIIKKIFLDLFKLDTIDYGKSKILTVAHDIDRSFYYQEKYYSPLMDTLEDDLAKHNLKCVSIARIISTIKGDLSYGNVKSPEGRFARALISKRFIGLFSRKRYPYSKMEEKIWDDILEETKAEKVIAIMPSRELCVACKKRNVWVADMQHGVIAHNHPWYGEAFRAVDPPEYLPHSFLVWDKGSADVINQWVNDKNVHVNIIGNRWLGRFKKASPDDQLVANTLEVYKQFLDKDKSGRKVILVTLSWGQEGLENGIIPETVINIIQRTSTKYRWILRLHPNQLKGFATNESKLFLKLFDEKLAPYCEWETPTRTALPAVLLNCDLHIAWFSSVVMEAAQFGVRSAALDPRLRGILANDYYDYYKQLGFIDFIENTEDRITKWIESNISVKMEATNYSQENLNYDKLIKFLIS